MERLAPFLAVCLWLGACDDDGASTATEPDGEAGEAPTDIGDAPLEAGRDDADVAVDAPGELVAEDVPPDAEPDPETEDHGPDNAVDLPGEDVAGADQGVDAAADAPGDAIADAADDLADEGADTPGDTPPEGSDGEDTPADVLADAGDMDTTFDPDVGSDCGNGLLDEGEDCDPALDARCPDTCAFTRDVSAHYTVEGPTSAIYTALAAGTSLDVAGQFDDGTASLTLPFELAFFGETFTAVNVSVNGFAAFGDPGDLHFLNVDFPALEPPDALLAPWWEDLYLDDGVAGGAALLYAVTGTTPFRVVTIEWRGLRLASHGTNNHRRFAFQLALFETSNRIEMRYGETSTSGNPPTATSASVGIENTIGTVGQDLLGCSPNCQGPPRPTAPNGFPRQSVISLEPF